MGDHVYITKDGLQKLQDDLKNLKDVKLAEVAQKIKEAREFGDISENVAYDEAMEQKAFIAGKIKELEEIIKNAKVIADDTTVSGVVSVGSKVKVHVEDDEMEFHIVGEMEANPAERKISHKSPIGAALVGKKAGEIVEVEAPMGILKYKIIEIA